MQEIETETKSIKDYVNVFPLRLLKVMSNLLNLQENYWNGALRLCACVTLVALTHSYIKYCFVDGVWWLKQQAGKPVLWIWTGPAGTPWDALSDGPMCAQQGGAWAQGALQAVSVWQCMLEDISRNGVGAYKTCRNAVTKGVWEMPYMVLLGNL